MLLQPSTSAQSRPIQLATHSPWSPCGVVLQRGTRLMVFETSARVTYTPLETWVARGEDGRRLIPRLRDARSALTQARLRALHAAADTTVRAALRRRYGSPLPLEQPVIAPADLAASLKPTPVRP